MPFKVEYMIKIEFMFSRKTYDLGALSNFQQNQKYNLLWIQYSKHPVYHQELRILPKFKLPKIV